MNPTSSRSHAIFTIELKCIKDLHVTTSQLNIVDLAGSERSKGPHRSDRLIEAGSINKSLMVLGQCIEVLRNQRLKPGIGIIPFRQNKLTEILFGNTILKKEDARATMIVNLNLNTPFEENIGVLRYASLAHEIDSIPNMYGMSRSPSTEVFEGILLLTGLMKRE
jgi:kinesin family member 20